MLNCLIETILNGFDPLLVDTRCEYEKMRDKKGWIVIGCIMAAIIIIPNVLNLLGIITL